MFWALRRRRVARLGLFDHHSLVFRRNRRAPERLDESGRRALGYLEIAFVGGNPDCTDLLAVDVAVSADQREYPAGIGVVTTAGIDHEPGRAFEACARPRFAAFFAAT